MQKRKRIEYTKDNLEPIVKESFSFNEVIKKLGVIPGANTLVLKKHLDKLKIDISHFYKGGWKVDKNKNIFTENSTTSRGAIKRNLFKLKLKQPICEFCGQDENWRGKKMSLILDHINGINNDHRLENLRIVCPNCNATLDTHCRGKG